MIYLTRRVEFSASHYYHNPAFTPEENARIFGKCNNPNGHGHNYTLEVTVKGAVNPKSGFVVIVGGSLYAQEIIKVAFKIVKYDRVKFFKDTSSAWDFLRTTIAKDEVHT